MHLAWEYKARQLWIVNVGDIKPMEFPTTFFLDYAWNPEKWNEDNLFQYYTAWAKEQFGAAVAKEAGEIIRLYTLYNSRRKPELLSHETYSLDAYDEWSRVNNEYQSLLQRATALAKKLPAQTHDAYYQLVLHPVKASANLYQLYYAVALNHQSAAIKSNDANYWAEKAQNYYLQDSLITKEYHAIAGGKWNGMMLQTHIGYTYWQQPEVQKMPEVFLVKDAIPTIDTTAPREASNQYKNATSFYEKNGIVSMEAAHYSNAQSRGMQWKVIPGIGRTGDGVTSFPVTYRTTLSTASPFLQYNFTSYSKGACSVQLYFSPTLDLFHEGGLKVAVSIDDEAPQVITINKNDNDTKTWEGWVASNSIVTSSKHILLAPGKHHLRYWMISPAVVLQKIVVNTGGLQSSYLGPEETRKIK
jgi:hypothetical protein